MARAFNFRLDSFAVVKDMCGTTEGAFLLQKISSKNSGHKRGARKLTGDNLIVVWPELSTLS